MKVTQHIPSFVEPDKPRFEGDIQSLPELIQTSWVQNFWAAPGFYQFVRTPNGEDSFFLMAEFEGGQRFYVVARMDGSDVEHLTRALPNWKGPLKPKAAKQDVESVSKLRPATGS